jgi:hypothetical protein
VIKVLAELGANMFVRMKSSQYPHGETPRDVMSRWQKFSMANLFGRLEQKQSENKRAAEKVWTHHCEVQLQGAGALPHAVPGRIGYRPTS